MDRFNDNAYWIAIAHLPKWYIERINQLIIQVLHENKLTWSVFFELDKKGWKDIFTFSDKELTDLEFAKNDLPRIAFIAEQLQNEGYQIIPLNSPDYPSVLKENLKAKNSPPVIYIKGRKSLLQEDAVAITGSRNAGKAALYFTDHVARKSASEHKIVVSGFAKGVDNQALDSTLEVHGKSIIVLPQGILTFQSGFKKHYESIVNGEVLVLSTFFPNAGWDVGFAMARNAYIYGLAKEIYVAETDSKGGTWEGAMNGLKRQRKIYVRIPEPNEKNANQKLIALGAIPVNADGVIIDFKIKPDEDLFKVLSVKSTVNEPKNSYNNDPDNIENQILTLLKKDNFTSKELIMALKLDLDTRKLTHFLKNNPNIKIIGGKPVKYGLNDAINLLLF
jgi:DNA processing protein